LAYADTYADLYYIRENIQPVRLSFQPLIFNQPAMFFSHTKSVNSTFSRLFSAQANRLIVRSLKNTAEVSF
jgi:hypothetical protein